MLKEFDYKLFSTLVVILLLPTVYTTVRIHLLGSYPSEWGVNIASQIMWLNVMYEVVQEGLILPLFYLLGKSLKDKYQLTNKVRTGLISCFLIYSFFCIFMVLFTKDILIFMQQKPQLIDSSVDYIRLETLAILFSILYKFINLVLVATKNIKYLLIILMLQMVLTIISDTFLISSLDISLKMGVNGIAIGNIVINVLLFIAGVVALSNKGIVIFSSHKLCFKWQKEWLRVGRISALESLIRNTAFIVIILKMINSVGESGTFWVANSFIWGWLLLPILALGELIKRNSGENPTQVSQQFSTYLWVVTFVILFWLISYPLWGYFLREVMNIDEYQKVLRIVIISIFFYVIFAYNNVVDSIFYGIGRTDLMLWQSVIVNSLFYGTVFILYQMGLFVPTLDKIAIMFGLGIAIDSIITFSMYFYLVRKNKLF